MFDGNNVTLYGDHNDKDLHLLMHSALVVGFDELDTFNKRDSSTLKAMITRQRDAFRPPYAASIEEFPRRFTLYGCGNNSQFLHNDPSGYRRYAIVEVDKLLDFAGLESERDQLWAEAWQRYSHDDLKWWEVDDASREAEKHVAPNLMAEKVLNWIEAQLIAKQSTMIKDGCLEFTMTQLITGIGEDFSAKNPSVTREIASELKKMGCTQKVKFIAGATKRIYSLVIP
jgi:predicted P-loop ATPase